MGRPPLLLSRRVAYELVVKRMNCLPDPPELNDVTLDPSDLPKILEKVSEAQPAPPSQQQQPGASYPSPQAPGPQGQYVNQVVRRSW